MSDVPPTDLAGKMAATVADDTKTRIFPEDPFKLTFSSTTNTSVPNPSLQPKAPFNRRIKNFPGFKPKYVRNMPSARINRADSFGSPRMESANLPHTPLPMPFVPRQSFDNSRQNASQMHQNMRGSAVHLPSMYFDSYEFDVGAFYEAIPGVTAPVHIRRNLMFHFDGIFCEPLPYAHLAEANVFTAQDNVDGSFPPKLILNIFQAPRHITGEGSEYVIGYDLGEQEIFLAIFSQLPENLRDFCLVWDDKNVVHSFKIRHLREILSEGPKTVNGELAISVLGDSPYTDPVIQIIFVILCGQWLVDFAEYIYWSKSSEEIEQYKNHFTSLLCMWHTALIGGSQRAVNGDNWMTNGQGNSHNPPSFTHYPLKDMLKHMLNMIESHPFVETDEVRMSAVNLAEEMTAVLDESH